MDANLITLLKQQNISVVQAATTLGVATSQIYRWARIGVNPNNPHYDSLLRLIGPEFQTTKPSKKAKVKRAPQTLNLVDTTLELRPIQSRPTSLPRVKIRPKASTPL